MSEPKGLAYITDNMEKLRNRIIMPFATRFALSPLKFVRYKYYQS